ncbi:glycoside hydrolase [Alicyclobacillus sp. SO9]|nr:glycoside hydrolase [Alicyclobacillus sp. SO9]
MVVGGPPRAVAPINQVKAVLDYATSVMDSKKILLGLVLYGYDWQIPWQKGTLAKGMSCNKAQNLAIAKESPIEFEPQSASPKFDYVEGGQKHTVWYEDALSIAAKLNLLYEYNLRGVTYWVLPNKFPGNWNLLHDAFDIKTV